MPSYRRSCLVINRMEPLSCSPPFFSVELSCSQLGAVCFTNPILSFPIIRSEVWYFATYCSFCAIFSSNQVKLVKKTLLTKWVRRTAVSRATRDTNRDKNKHIPVRACMRACMWVGGCRCTREWKTGHGNKYVGRQTSGHFIKFVTSREISYFFCVSCHLSSS